MWKMNCKTFFGRIHFETLEKQFESSSCKAKFCSVELYWLIMIYFLMFWVRLEPKTHPVATHPFITWMKVQGPCTLEFISKWKIVPGF